MLDELFALCALGFTMLNSQQVNAQANSQTDRAGDHSTANNYDRLHPSKDNGVEHRFASIFASLKSHFGAGADRQKQDTFASSFKKSVDDSVQSREQAQELQDQKKDKAERDRKVREQREALAEARRESLEQANDTLAANAEKTVQQRKDLEQQASDMLEDAESKAALRPSDILAAAMAAAAQAQSQSQNQNTAASGSGTGTVSGDAAFSGSGSATLTASSGASFSGSSASSGAAFASGSAAESMTAFSGAAGTSGTVGTSGAAGTSGSAVSGGAVLASGSGSGAIVDSAESGSALAQSAVSGAAGMGTGSESGSGNNTASYAAVGLGNDEATPAAQAAAQMLQIDGVETDENLAQSLNQLNRQQLQQTQPHSPSAAEQLASMDGKELRKSLDALARENNVSKLSLKMANPQALAAMRRDAQMLSQLPTSQNTLASLTGTGEATRLHLMANAANGSTNGISAFGAMTGSDASIEQVAATGMRQMEVTGRTSTEILMQQNKLRQESHGLVEKTAMTAAARAEQATKQLESQTLTAQQMATSAANRAAQQAAMGSLAQGQVPVTATPNFVGSGAPVFADATMLTPQPQVPNTLAAEVASKAAGMAALGGDKTVASGGAGAGAGLFGQDVDGTAESAKGNAAASAASNADSRAALLRLAMAQDEITTAAMHGEDVSQFADDAASAAAAAATSELQLRPQQSSVLTQAIQSLQQGARPESSGTTYENSILAGMLTANALTEKDLAAAADESARSAVSGVDVSVRASAGTGANFDANSATASVGANSAEVRAALLQDETNAQAMVQEQLQAQAEARAELEREFTNMNFSADPTSDAAMLHERVMRMAARNLKHLAVDLNPRDLGKMRIAIELSDNNDALSVTLAAVSPETRALLAHTLPVLEDTLAQQNVATNAHILDLNEIEAEENAEKAVASSAAAVHTLSDPKRIGEQEVAANAANADASENNTRSNAMRWAQSRSVTDGQGRLRGV